MANRITTVFDAEVRGFRDGVQKIKKDVSEAEGAVGKFKAGWKGAADEFKNSRAAQAAVGAAVVKLASDSVAAASALEESANAVSTTFDQASGDIGKLADEAATKYGMSKRAFNEMAVAFSGFAAKVVGEGGDIAATVDDMATRVADFASVHNLEMSDAMTKFQSALAGETEAMRRYGIDVSAAAVEQHALASGLVASKSEMTEAVKVQARYSLLMQETNKWAGDFAATSDSLANSQRTLAANVENLQAELGAHLVPALAETTSQMNELLDVAEKLNAIDLAAQIAKWTDISPKGFVDKFKDVQDHATSTVDTLGDFNGTIEELQAHLDALGYDQDDAAAAMEWYTAKLAAGTGAVGDLSGALDDQAGALEEQAEDATTAAEKLSDYRNETNNAAGALAGAFDAGVDVNEMLAEQAENLEEASDEVRTLADEFAGLLGVLDDNDAYRSLEDSIDDVIDAQEKAGDSAGRTAREQEAAARDAAGAVDDLKRRVIDYADAIGGVPSETVSDIIAQIDQGKLAEAEAALAALERTRQTRIDITTHYRTVGSSTAPTVRPTGGPRAEGGPTYPNTMHPILEKGESEILEENGKAYLLSANSGKVTPLGDSAGGGSSSTSGGGGITMMPGAIQITAIGAATPELDRIIQKSLDNWNRRTGRSR